jgi:hypothetical protein
MSNFTWISHFNEKRKNIETSETEYRCITSFIQNISTIAVYEVMLINNLFPIMPYICYTRGVSYIVSYI